MELRAILPLLLRAHDAHLEPREDALTELRDLPARAAKAKDV